MLWLRDKIQVMVKSFLGNSTQPVIPVTRWSRTGVNNLVAHTKLPISQPVVVARPVVYNGLMVSEVMWDKKCNIVVIWHAVCHHDFCLYKKWSIYWILSLHLLCDGLSVWTITSPCSSRWEAHRCALWWVLSPPEERREPDQPLCRRPRHSKIMLQIMSCGGK